MMFCHMFLLSFSRCQTRTERCFLGRKLKALYHSRDSINTRSHAHSPIPVPYLHLNPSYVPANLSHFPNSKSVLGRGSPTSLHHKNIPMHITIICWLVYSSSCIYQQNKKKKEWLYIWTCRCTHSYIWHFVVITSLMLSSSFSATYKPFNVWLNHWLLLLIPL